MACVIGKLEQCYSTALQGVAGYIAFMLGKGKRQLSQGYYNSIWKPEMMVN